MDGAGALTTQGGQAIMAVPLVVEAAGQGGGQVAVGLEAVAA
ncbi:MAG TPA: hypothetical protein VGF15_05345 [Solirubrobacteraceae bacterium]